MHSLVYGVIGGFVGYIALAIYANTEVFQFYALRRLATGCEAMADIIEQPADRFVVWGLLVMFIGGGALLGTLIGRRLAALIAPSGRN